MSGFRCSLGSGVRRRGCRLSVVTRVDVKVKVVYGPDSVAGRESVLDLSTFVSPWKKGSRKRKISCRVFSHARKLGLN